MQQPEPQYRDAGRRVAQCLDSGQLSGQRNLIRRHARAEASSAAGAAGAGFGLSSAAGAVSERDFSSFIIGEGADTAPLIFTIRWRSTASLNLNACSSSPSVSLSHSTFMRT